MTVLTSQDIVSPEYWTYSSETHVLHVCTPILLRHVYMHVCIQTHSSPHYSLSSYAVLEEVWLIAYKTGSALNMDAQDTGTGCVPCSNWWHLTQQSFCRISLHRHCFGGSGGDGVLSFCTASNGKQVFTQAWCTLYIWTASNSLILFLNVCIFLI